MKIAITGGIAEGKSTVLSMLGEMGFSTQSADDVARSLFQSPEINLKLAAIVGQSEPISAAMLRAAIISSPDLRRAVNSVMHARVMQTIEASSTTFVEVPLLIEACLQDRFDQVWVVTCGPRTQMRRLLSRYGSRSDALAMISAQLPTKSKLAFADVVIRTNGPHNNVRRVLNLAVSKIRDYS